jgi:hypothetical protein
MPGGLRYHCAPCQYAAPLKYWRSRTRSTPFIDAQEPMPSADLVGGRPITGSARDYADPNWAAVGLVAARSRTQRHPYRRRVISRDPGRESPSGSPPLPPIICESIV